MLCINRDAADLVLCASAVETLCEMRVKYILLAVSEAESQNKNVILQQHCSLKKQRMTKGGKE